MKKCLFWMAILLAFATPAHGDGPDAPAGPNDDASAMFTIKDIYNRLDTGAAGTKRTGGFAGPAAGPSVGVMPTLNDVMGKAPDADNTDGALPSEVDFGKTFWGLNAGENMWGPQTGEAVAVALPDGFGLPGDTTTYVIVKRTDDPVANGLNLLDAYAAASDPGPADENHRTAVILGPAITTWAPHSWFWHGVCGHHRNLRDPDPAHLRHGQRPGHRGHPSDGLGCAHGEPLGGMHRDHRQHLQRRQ